MNKARTLDCQNSYPNYPASLQVVRIGSNRRISRVRDGYSVFPWPVRLWFYQSVGWRNKNLVPVVGENISVIGAHEKRESIIYRVPLENCHLQSLHHLLSAEM